MTNEKCQMSKFKIQMTNDGVRNTSTTMNVKCQSSNVKSLMSNDKGTTARPLLAVIGPVFVFRGLLSSVSGLVYAVCRPPSSVRMITDTKL
jgi:hypothetical protein